MSEFEDAFDRVKDFIGEDLDETFFSGSRMKYLRGSDLGIVVNRLDEMIKEQRREALSELAKMDSDLILKGY